MQGKKSESWAYIITFLYLFVLRTASLCLAILPFFLRIVIKKSESWDKKSHLYMNILHSRCAWILQCIPLQFQFQCDRCIWPEWPSTNSIFNQSLTFSEIRMRVVLTFCGWLPGCYTVARVVKNRVVSFHVHLRVLSSSRWKHCIWSLSKDTAQQDRWFESLKLRKSNSKQH